VRLFSLLSLVLCRIAAVLLPVIVGLLWLLDGLDALLPLLKAGPEGTFPWHRLGPSWALVMAFIASGGLWSLSNAFAEFAAGSVFSTSAASAVRRFSWTLGVLAVLDAASRLSGAILERQGAWGIVPFDVRTVAFLVVAVFLAIVAQALVEGARLAEDSESIV